MDRTADVDIFLQVYPENLQNQQNSPTGDGSAAVDQPGLKDMAIKAIDILQSRAQKDQGWFLMAEAANIDKVDSGFSGILDHVSDHVVADDARSRLRPRSRRPSGAR